jgi:hypothetical protein
MHEANVTINGHTLSDAETMAVRVAVSSFRGELMDPEFRMGIGEALAQGYDRQLRNVEYLLMQGANHPLHRIHPDPDADRARRGWYVCSCGRTFYDGGENPTMCPLDTTTRTR